MYNNNNIPVKNKNIVTQACMFFRNNYFCKLSITLYIYIYFKIGGFKYQLTISLIKNVLTIDQIIVILKFTLLFS